MALMQVRNGNTEKESRTRSGSKERKFYFSEKRSLVLLRYPQAKRGFLTISPSGFQSPADTAVRNTTD